MDTKAMKATGLILTKLALAIPLVFLFIGASLNVDAASRIKDIVDFEGVRENQLVGYGLVVGLNNTGDTLKTGHFTKQSLECQPLLSVY